MKKEMSVDFPATVYDIDTVCGDIGQFLKDNDIKDNIFYINLIIREALTNAVIHGSKEDVNEIVRCKLSIDETHLIIEVHDNGDGFDWENRFLKDHSVDQTSGRGLPIFEKYTSSVAYNDKGNEIKIKIKIIRGEEMDIMKIKKVGAVTTILLAKDLVASTVKDIKEDVKKIVSESTTIIFDMEDVQMVDSLGIGFLVATHNSLSGKSGEIKVVNTSTDILELFKSMHLNKHFSVTGA